MSIIVTKESEKAARTISKTHLDSELVRVVGVDVDGGTVADWPDR
jgi:hypothetical protein